jgi:putative heme transporter
MKATSSGKRGDVMTTLEAERRNRTDTMKSRTRAERFRGSVNLVALSAVVLIVVTKRASLTRSIDHLGHARWPWIPFTVAFELVSMATFALMQRQLLGSGGKHVGYRTIMATTFAANALAVSVPVAGPELGTAFLYRRFKKLGADSTLASWTLLVGGLVSWVGVVVVLAAGGVLSDNTLVIGAAIAAGLVAVGASALMRAVVRRAQLPPRLERSAVWLVDRSARLKSRPVDDPHGTVQHWLRGLDSLHLPWPQWVKVSGYGLTNWLADAGVLAISILAVGATVPWHTLLLVYSLATVVGSVGITPGGIGVVEGTLCVGLVSTGVPAALALAAVLLYRLVSFWLVMAVGWLVFFYLRRERLAETQSLHERALS